MPGHMHELPLLPPAYERRHGRRGSRLGDLNFDPYPSNLVPTYTAGPEQGG